MRGECTRRTSKSPVLQTLPSPSRPPNFALTLLFFAVFFFLLAVLDLPARLQCSPVDIDPILSPNADLIACFASREACLVRAASFAVDRLDCLPSSTVGLIAFYNCFNRRSICSYSNHSLFNTRSHGELCLAKGGT